MKHPFSRLASRIRSRALLTAGAALALVLGGAYTAHSLTGDLGIADAVEGHAITAHVSQAALNTTNASNPDQAFDDAFEAGDTLFATTFLSTDGIGAKVHAGERFTRTPRPDQTDVGEWATHTPARATGPNASSCKHCHNQGEGPAEESADDGGGVVVDNAVRDPNRLGLPGLIQRNAPHLFGMGAVQLLAEEMTADLLAIKNGSGGCSCASTAAATAACSKTVTLTTKGVDFGTATITRAQGATSCTVVVNTPAGGVKRVSDDLVVKPFQWKGSVAFVRAFQRDAGHNELGMQANELLATDTTDGDADMVTNELTVGDLTALAVYGGAQPRPLTSIELNDAGVKPGSVSAADRTAITNGAARFNSIGCNSCHIPTLTLNGSVYSEPSTRKEFRDATFPGGRTPSSQGLLTTAPIHFDITTDIPDNRFVINGAAVNLGNFKKDSSGKVQVQLFGDLRRHQLGTALQEQIDEVGTGRGTFLTENLWGVGSTPPYMHDGRASTLTEAILLHHGEAETQRSNFVALTTAQQKEVIAFLKSLVLFKQEAP